MSIRSPRALAARCLPLALLLGAGLLASPGMAQDVFAGRWKITSSVLAPWAGPAHPLNDKAEIKRLIGKTVDFGAKAVAGPSPLGCRKPQYEFRRADTADMLFQGELAEPDDSGKARDAVALARSLGMMTPTIPSLVDACSEVEFHMVSPDRLMFGLNDEVYMLDRVSKP